MGNSENGTIIFEMSETRKLSFRESNIFLMYGLSILKIHKRWYKNPRGIVLLLMCFCLVALCSFFIYKSHEYIDKTIVNLFFSVNVFICFCKGVDLIIFQESFNRVVVFFEENLSPLCDREDVLNKYEKYMKKSTLWTCRIFGLNFFVLSISLAFPLINMYVTQKTSLPIGSSYQITEYYAFEFVFQSFGYVCSALIASTFGSFYICCCIFITYQLDHLVHEILSLKLNRNYNEHVIRSKLAHLVEKHVLIIR